MSLLDFCNKPLNIIFRVQLGQKYKKTAKVFLTAEDINEVKMTFQDYRAMFGVYTVSLCAPVMCFFFEMICFTNWKIIIFQKTIPTVISWLRDTGTRLSK